MTLEKINDAARYQEIVYKYKHKGTLSNDYLYAEVEELTARGLLYECCGAANAFLFVRKDECLRVYYYLNDLTERTIFDLDDNLLVEILFRGALGTLDAETAYLTKCGFDAHLRRDQYSAMYKNLTLSSLISGVIVRKAQDAEEVAKACDLFNRSFDHYSGDYISKGMEQQLLRGGNILLATDVNGQFAGALHQTVEKGVAWISHIAVLPEYRGHGIGKALLEAYIELNHQNDKSRYMLWVQAQNEPAVRMYQQKGFKYTNKSTLSMLKLKK